MAMSQTSVANQMVASETFPNDDGCDETTAHTKTAAPTKPTNDQPKEYRKIPWMSEIVYFPVLLLFAYLHWTLRFCPKLEGTVSTAIQGGYFGFPLIPLAFTWIAIRAMESFSGIPSSWLWSGIVLPFSVAYCVQNLVLDQTHKVVKNSGLLFPRNFVEVAVHGCLGSMFHYHKVTCIPWSEDAKLDPNRQYIFCLHPHGIHPMPLVQFCTPGSELDKRFPGLVGPKLTGIAATVLFKIPVVREAFFHMGYIDASRKVCSAALEQGQSLYIVPGGEEESMWTQQGKDIVVLKHRKGFVRLALSYGVDLVPIFGAYNTDVYKTYSFAFQWRLWLQKKTGIALPIFHGRWFTTLPYPVPMTLLVGKPIPTPTPKILGTRPDEILVEEYHIKYIRSLKAMHSAYVLDRSLIIK